MELCLQVYGEESMLTSRLCLNTGILYEDSGDYVTAFRYFERWAKVSEVVYGHDHPKSQSAKRALNEPTYTWIAQCLKENQLTAEQINREIGWQPEAA